MQTQILLLHEGEFNSNFLHVRNTTIGTLFFGGVPGTGSSSSSAITMSSTVRSAGCLHMKPKLYHQDSASTCTILVIRRWKTFSHEDKYNTINTNITYVNFFKA